MGHVCAFVPKSFCNDERHCVYRRLEKVIDFMMGRCLYTNEQGHPYTRHLHLYICIHRLLLLCLGSRRSCLKQCANSFKRPFLMSYSCANTLFCGVAIAFEMLIDVWHVKLHNRFLDQISNRVYTHKQ